MNIQEKLKRNGARNALFNHSFFNMPRNSGFSKDDTLTLLGQYWHPLHYFPDFLAGLITKAPGVDFKCAIADILNEELGEGTPARAHERFYIESFTELGFSQAALTQTPPTRITAQLVDCYRAGSQDFLTGLGGLYATESTDLAIVSGIGKMVRSATETEEPIMWIDIHVQQEPNHVVQTDHTLVTLTPAEEAEVTRHAETMWQYWIDFFDAIEQQIKVAA